MTESNNFSVSIMTCDNSSLFIYTNNWEEGLIRIMERAETSFSKINTLNSIEYLLSIINKISILFFSFNRYKLWIHITDIFSWVIIKFHYFLRIEFQLLNFGKILIIFHTHWLKYLIMKTFLYGIFTLFSFSIIFPSPISKYRKNSTSIFNKLADFLTIFCTQRLKR